MNKPMERPNGKPTIIATDDPITTMERANDCRDGEAIRTAIGATIAQNTAWDAATTRRAPMRAS